MKVVVLVNAVPDTAATPEIAPDGRTVLTEQLEFVLDPYDEYAVEEAVRLKENLGAEVIAVSLGGNMARKALRCAFAMGVESGVLVRLPEGIELTGRGRSLGLLPTLRELAPDLILAGKQTVDSDDAQVPERVAELLDFVHASAVSQLTIVDTARLLVKREIEGGHLLIDLPLPALVTTEKGINVPRYPALPQVLKAKSKPLHEMALPLGVDLTAGWQVESVTRQQTARRQQIFSGEISTGVQQLAELLRQEA
ncbi:MAG: electron transfer flavoprotein subunit beta/FixA family protein [Desulfuromonadales bacterium]|nr:electron transfer flavoprotein subunit beta/FixA family protein [Desulfuromonadales bacterium]